ncbi:MAG: 50S ribosomal protein P1 [Candidatus Altiarchaeota archaeon]|nr:50S ribosomal protein P1 [Candidatus Altiarchaeota archaeon]
MEYIYAALLLHKAGKDITEAGLKKVLVAAGVKTDDGRMKALVSALKDISIEEAIKTPVAVAAPVAAPAAAGKAKGAKKEEKDEKEEEKKEEAAAEGLASLFG